MRAVQLRGAEVDDDFVEFMSTCVQCRGCEPACPSGVPFGRLMEGTREMLAAERRITPWWQRLVFAALAHHRLVLVGSTAMAIAQRVRLVPKSFGVPKLPLLRGPAVDSTGTDAWLFTGCVMDAWMRNTHRATARVLNAMRVSFSVPQAGAGCCGALHVHAGLHDQASKLAVSVISSMPGSAPILVNSAGCGAALKDYARILDTPSAHDFVTRVYDVHEWIAARMDLLPELSRRCDPVIIQDPCHLRHVQKAHLPVRTILAQVAELTELDDDGICCGAGGAYSALQPVLAGAIRDKKLEAIDRALGRSAAKVLVSANPGCTMHLQASLALRGVKVAHPMDLLAEALP